MIIRLDDEFISMVDELVRISDQDDELKRGIKWLDDESKRRGISFYEMFYMAIAQQQAEQHADEWMRSR